MHDPRRPFFTTCKCYWTGDCRAWRERDYGQRILFGEPDKDNDNDEDWDPDRDGAWEIQHDNNDADVEESDESDSNGGDEQIANEEACMDNTEFRRDKYLLAYDT